HNTPDGVLHDPRWWAGVSRGEGLSTGFYRSRLRLLGALSHAARFTEGPSRDLFFRTVGRVIQAISDRVAEYGGGGEMARQENPTPFSPELLEHAVSRRGLLKRAAVLGLSVPTVATLLAACGEEDDADSGTSDEDDDTEADTGGDDEESDEDPADTEEEEGEDEDESEDESGSAQTGGSVTWAIDQDPGNLIPFGATPTANYWGKEFMYDSLMEFDRDLAVQPALAESFDVNDDATVYTFNLREGVLFHNGDEMTAADVIFSLESAGDPPEPGTDLGFFESFQEGTFEAVDDYTVELTLDSPDPTLPGLLAWGRHTPIVPENIFDEIDVRTEGIGTGPFQLVEYISDERVVYERFADYWKDGVPGIDQLTLSIITDESARVSALRSGEIDGGTFTPDVVQTLEDDDQLEVLRGLFSAPRVIQFTIHGEEPWANLEVRQAINAAVDRQVIIDNVYAGDAEVTGPIPPGYGEWFIPAEELWENWYTQDVERAQELMAEAGFEDGFDVELQAIAGPEHVPIAEIIQQQLQEININAEVVPLEIGEFAANNADGEFEWQATGRGMRGDPSQFVVDFRPPARREWFTAWENDELTELYEEALQISDTAERQEMYRRIQEIILDEVPNMYTVQPYRFHVVQNRLQGMYVSYTDSHVGLREVTVED
ncbi:MAG: ABC transporter substrate-binding protein, partial [Chloroflexota bacterium]